MPMQILGAHMGPHLQQEVKRRFVHRFTGDHAPDWARKPMPNGQAYPLQFADDADWLAHTYFWVNKTGRLSARHSYCESHATWPNNPELRRTAA